mmetsp:Transcript_18505/g.55813  ORF Transcript_18505/g.55813 Transcript_18505/m.55813 type:complete len:194 (-) Transcript_18505:414-995(-)
MVREHRNDRQEWLRNHDRSLAEVADKPTSPLTLVLDNVRSAANVGNIFRAAEAARIEAIVCCGITPTPPEPKLLRTAMGAAAYVQHSHEGSTLEAIRSLKARGLPVWACETTSHAQVHWRSEMPRDGLALVFGNELIGVDVAVMNECDGFVKVPTHGVKNSLNVATCASVLIWEALRQWDDTEAGGGDGGRHG